MTIKEKQIQLSKYRLRQANESILPEELGRSINKAFELRQEGDYREYVELSYEEVKPFIEKAKIFLLRVKDYLEENVFNVD